MAEPYICIVEYDASMRRLYGAVGTISRLPLKLFGSVPPIETLLGSKGIITDGSLGQRSGGDLAKSARENGYQGLIFLVSSDPDDYSRFFPFFNNWFVKPVSIDQIKSLYSDIAKHNL